MCIRDRTIRALAQDIEQQVDLAGRLFFESHKKSASNAGAREALSQRLVVEDLEPAALDHRGHVAAAEAKRGIGRENRVSQNAWFISVRIHRVLWQHHATPWIRLVARSEIGVEAVRRGQQRAVRWE